MTRLDKKDRISNAIDPTSLILPSKFTELIDQCNKFRKDEFQRLSTFNYKQLNHVINMSFEQVERDCTSKETNTITYMCYTVDCLRLLCPERIPDLIKCTSKINIKNNNNDVGIIISYVTSKLYNQVDDSESLKSKLSLMESEFDTSYLQIPIMYFLLYLVQNSPKAVLLNIQRNSFMNIVKKAAYSNKEEIRSIAADTLRKYIDLIKDKPEVNLYDFVKNILSSIFELNNNIGTLLIFSVFFEKKLFQYFPSNYSIFDYLKKVPSFIDDEIKVYKIYCELLIAPYVSKEIFSKEIPILQEFFSKNNLNTVSKVLKIYSSAFLLFAQNCVNINFNWKSKLSQLITIANPYEESFLALEFLFEHSKINSQLITSLLHATGFTMEFAKIGSRIIKKFPDQIWASFRMNLFLKFNDEANTKPTVEQLTFIAFCRPFTLNGFNTPDSTELYNKTHKTLLSLLKSNDYKIRANVPAALLQNAKGTEKMPEIVEKLLIQTLSEKNSYTRTQTLLAFPESTAIFMTSQASFNCFDTLVHDECYKVRMAVVTLLGRIVKISPFSVLPLMRRVILDDLFLLNSQRSHRLQKEMAKLLLPLIQVAEEILPAYAQTICQIALEHFSTPPKREQTILERESFFDISTSMSKVINVIAKKNINLVAPYLDQFIESFMMILKQHNKKELKIAVIETLITFISNCDNQLHFDRKNMFSELTTIASKWNSKKLNLAFLKLFGLLGAVDVNMINNNKVENTEIEEIDIDHHRYCLNVVCKTLFGVLQDNSLNIHHSETTVQLVEIFILHEESSFDWYVKFMPLFLNEIRTTRNPIFLKLLQNLLVSIPPTWLTCFTDDLITLVYEMWNTEQLLDVLGVVSALAAALNNQFAPFLPQCITLLLDCLFSSRSSRPDICLKVLESILALRHISNDYLFLIIPEIIQTASRSLTPEETRIDALDTLRIIIQSCDCQSYSAEIVRCIKSCIQTQGKLREIALQVLYSLQVSLGKKFHLFQDIFNRILDKDENYKSLINVSISTGNFSSFEFINASEKLRNSTFVSIPQPTDSQIQSIQQTIEQKKQQRELCKNLINNLITLQDYIITQTPWGMKEFFKKFVETLIKYSPENCISITSTLANNLSSVSESLFNVAFLSCWEMLNNVDKNIPSFLLTGALESRYLSDNSRSLIVNLIEFMDRAEKSIEIDPNFLCMKCIEFGNNARAFYFAQRWYQKQENSNNESSKKMIEIASSLGLHQTVIGLATVLLKGCSTLPSSLEHLGKWEEALNIYNEILNQKVSDFDEENIAGKLRCMKHLMMWNDMVYYIPKFNEFYNKNKNKNNSKSSIIFDYTSRNEEADDEINRENEIAASLIEACHNLQRFTEIPDLLHHCNKNDVSSFVFAAIAQFKNGQKDKAEKTINKAFDTLSQRARTMFKHDKSMLYQTCLESMKLTELSEIINNKVNRSLWNERLILCRKTFDVAFSIMSIRFLYEKSFQQSILLLKRALKTHNWTLFSQVEKQFFTEKQRKNSYEIIRIDAMAKWEQGLLNEALKQIMEIDINKIINNDDENNKKLASKIAFLRGQWILRMTPPNEVNKVIEKVMPHIELATKLDAQNYKAWHRWSWVCANIFHADNTKTLAAIDAIKGFMECVKLRAVNSFSDLLQMVSIFFMANLDDESFQSVSTLISSLDDAFILRISQQLFAQLRSEKGRISQFVIELIRSRLPRLFHVLLYPIILLRNGDERNNQRRIRSRSISNVVHQKMPKLLPNSISLASGMNQAQIQSPLSSTSTTSTSKINEVDFAIDVVDQNFGSKNFSERIAEELIQNFEVSNPTAVHEAEIISNGLLKASYLKIERVMTMLTKMMKLRKKNEYKKMIDLFENEIVYQLPSNINDEHFLKLHQNELNRLHNLIQCLVHPATATMSKNQSELTTLIRLFYKKLDQELQDIRSIKLSEISTELAEMKDSVLSIPGTYAARYINHNEKSVKTVDLNTNNYLNTDNSNLNVDSKLFENDNYELITITSFHPALEMIKSKQYPRLVVINGSDGCQHTSLLKGQEDLRLDQNVMQFFELINMHIENSFTPESRHLRVHTYSITPLSNMSGLIQFIDNTDTIYRLISSYRNQRGIQVKLEENIGKDKYNKIECLLPIQRLEFLRDVNKSCTGNDLREVIWLKSGNAFNWIQRTSRFAQTSAIVSIVGYILGLGDRHPSNIMMHRLSGDVIHIDLGDCFEIGKKRKKFPEKVPFRLTRMIKKAFGPSGVEGEFRLTCEQTMKLVRGHRESIMTVLNIFLQDPLEGTIKSRKVSSSESIYNTRNNINNDIDDDVDDGKNNQVQMVADEDEDENEVKLNITDELERITSKIIGKDFNNEVELEIKDQVDKLIKMAQDEYNLAHMYPGWLPFW